MKVERAFLYLFLAYLHSLTTFTVCAVKLVNTPSQFHTHSYSVKLKVRMLGHSARGCNAPQTGAVGAALRNYRTIGFSDVSR